MYKNSGQYYTVGDDWGGELPYKCIYLEVKEVLIVKNCSSFEAFDYSKFGWADLNIT